MESKVTDVIGGFEHFLTEQKAVPGDAHMIVVLFDTEVTKYADVQLSDVRPLDNSSYKAGGSTALLDAVADAIDATDKRVQPNDKVIFLVMTDGHENSSQHTTLEQIKSRIIDRRGQGWEFVFLGADENAWAQAGDMGFSQQSTGRFVPTGAGTRAAYTSASANIAKARTTGKSLEQMNWTTEEDTSENHRSPTNGLGRSGNPSS
jgi:hypothetical protein